MKLYTSNFAKSAKDPNAVAICLGVPWWYKGKKCPKLAPSRELLSAGKSKQITHEEWTNRYYNEVLKPLDPQTIVDELGDGAIMLCWESPTAFCHRQLVARWITTDTGIEVVEWYNPQKVQGVQGSFL